MDTCASRIAASVHTEAAALENAAVMLNDFDGQAYTSVICSGLGAIISDPYDQSTLQLGPGIVCANSGVRETGRQFEIAKTAHYKLHMLTNSVLHSWIENSCAGRARAVIDGSENKTDKAVDRLAVDVHKMTSMLKPFTLEATTYIGLTDRPAFQWDHPPQYLGSKFTTDANRKVEVAVAAVRDALILWIGLPATLKQLSNGAYQTSPGQLQAWFVDSLQRAIGEDILFVHITWSMHQNIRALVLGDRNAKRVDKEVFDYLENILREQWSTDNELKQDLSKIAAVFRHAIQLEDSEVIPQSELEGGRSMNIKGSASKMEGRRLH